MYDTKSGTPVGTLNLYSTVADIEFVQQVATNLKSGHVNIHCSVSALRYELENTASQRSSEIQVPCRVPKIVVVSGTRDLTALMP